MDQRAFDLWNDFRNKILYETRFTIKHEMLDYLENFAKRSIQTIEKDSILYRARLYDGDSSFLFYIDSDFNYEGLEPFNALHLKFMQHDIESRSKSGFWGYDDKDSFIPLDSNLVNDGRANPAFIRYLYTAEDPYTALVEVRPYLQSKVSVSSIMVNEPLTVTDFSYDSWDKFDGFERDLIFQIMYSFSSPSDGDRKDYIPTQYIAEFIKTLGFEGVRFNSSLHDIGKNVTIFNFNKCSAVGSKLYEIKDICFKATALAPKDEKPLMHRKLFSNALLPLLLKDKDERGEK